MVNLFELDSSWACLLGPQCQRTAVELSSRMSAKARRRPKWSLGQDGEPFGRCRAVGLPRCSVEVEAWLALVGGAPSQPPWLRQSTKRLALRASGRRGGGEGAWRRLHCQALVGFLEWRRAARSAICAAHARACSAARETVLRMWRARLGLGQGRDVAECGRGSRMRLAETRVESMRRLCRVVLCAYAQNPRAREHTLCLPPSSCMWHGPLRSACLLAESQRQRLVSTLHGRDALDSRTPPRICRSAMAVSPKRVWTRDIAGMLGPLSQPAQTQRNIMSQMLQQRSERGGVEVQGGGLAKATREGASL